MKKKVSITKKELSRKVNSNLSTSYEKRYHVSIEN